MTRRGALRLGRDVAVVAAAGTAAGAFAGIPEARADTPCAPPKIIGPVTVISPHVRVDNALAGTTVTLFADGGPVTSVTASPDGVTMIPTAGLGLTAGRQLVATQTMNGGPGEPSRPEPVLAAPNPLGVVRCVSLVHGCMDWLVVTGVAMGATVVVRYAGTIVGEAVCDWPDWPQVSVLLNKGRTGPFAMGSTLEIRQQYVDPVTKSLVGGPVTAGPTVVASPVAPPLPTPQFQRPPAECDVEVGVTGVVPGASLRVTIGGANLDYPYVGDTIRCAVDRLYAGRTVQLYQRFFTGCTAESRTGVLTTGAAVPGEKPEVHAHVCQDTAVVTVSRLRRGAQVVAWATDFESGTVQLGAWTASHDGDDWFPLLSSAAGVLRGSGMAVYVQVSYCGALVQSDYVDVDFSATDPEIAIGPLYQCGSLVEVRGTSPHALVWLTAAGRQLSGVVAATSGTTVLRCYRPLEAWRTEVPVDDVVPGALVSVYVNGRWRGAREATSGSVEVPVGQLGISASGLPDTVYAVQQLCDGSVTGRRYLHLDLPHRPAGPVHRRARLRLRRRAADLAVDRPGLHHEHRLLDRGHQGQLGRVEAGPAVRRHRVPGPEDGLGERRPARAPTGSGGHLRRAVHRRSDRPGQPASHGQDHPAGRRGRVRRLVGEEARRPLPHDRDGALRPGDGHVGGGEGRPHFSGCRVRTSR
ncbi:hypothetical protein [Sphaerisporangium aureirubrum]